MMKPGAEKAREATIELLRICNQAYGLPELMRDLIRFFQRVTGCEAVGVRLREGEDFPYFVARGFSEEFVAAENRLCAIDPAGELVRDYIGHPSFDCMCGNVLCGRFDPSKSFFTASGSFWSSDTSKLLATTTDADRQAKTRNRCNSEGYESVALIPLRTQGETFGLFQFNDKRKGRFTAGNIALLESLVTYVAIALAKFKADEALLESGRFSQQVIQNVEEGVVVYGRDLRYQVWNPFMERITGLGSADVLGKHPEDLFPFLLKAGVIERIERALSGETTGAVDLRYGFPSAGGSGWVSYKCAPLRNTKGEIAGVIGTVRDITGRKQAEVKLQESEERYRELFENASDIIYTHDLEGNITSFNKAAEQPTGYTPDEALKTNILSVCAPEYVEIVRQRMSREIAEGDQTRYELEIVGKNGRRIPLEVSTRNIYRGGKPVGVQCIARDITERKRAEKALGDSEAFTRTVMDNLPIGLAVNSVDPSVDFLYMNDNFPRFYRTTRKALSDSNAFWDVVFEDPVFREKIRKRVLEDCASGDRARMHWEDVPIIRQGGETAFINACNTPVPEKSLMISTVWDVTERKRAEEALRASQRMIEEIINAIPVRVFWKDRNLMYLGCNSEFARDAGFTDPKDVIGKDDYQMGWREQAELYRADDRKVIESGGPKLLIEEPQTTSEGNTITLLTSKIPLRNSDGEI
ncbi:PAS domain S-box protein, partial [Candidatus Deferrimicrobium sp.]|uniref:PAS domain S-box protein n=1 Tax=Candidatus Deferrimicrobium sp. TaxID=3060586 RepID=UPI003C33305E